MDELARAGRTSGAPTVRGPRLSASWQRSHSYGAPTDRVDPVFIGTVGDDSLFFRCGQEVLGGLQETLANEPVSLMLTDEAGHVLSRACHDRTLVDALDRSYLAPGFAFSEREAGTNGLGLALADRAPSLVRGEEHYCTGLWNYTCAAVPVTDPVHGRLLGSVNLTTWSRKSANLLLALAQTAAGHTSALMLSRGHGLRPHPTPRGEVFRVNTAARPDSPSPQLSPDWETALAEVQCALAAGRSVGVVGERGAGKTALLSAALCRAHPRDRILNARPPEPRDTEPWLTLWTPELGKGNTSVIAAGVDALPSWAATELAEIVTTRARRPITVTAREATAIPEALSRIVDTVVEIPPLRRRPDDILALAEHFGTRARNRRVRFTPKAARTLRTYHWPDNVAQLRRVVREAANRSDVVDTRHLPPEVLCGPTRTLTRIETVERDEIVRCLAEPGTTVTRAAEILGMSRATIYRKISQYGIRTPR
ncbi:energy-coupling factor transporter ATP-binding protein EcfA2 [Saccharopolyspora lacisalsi]|uniref:Energy-coupling factor transporter ATP-binding protein EcfA2 n=1 Tax=Halosaccharopolyspora lacisalsi TaxID=1000566 RepID=A0A839DQH8_9PSEU|nr:helix-turn-helix domain-containing protein [Halosaccharopolyspora lacisalsi]MBA8824242.1 energy-coupling factor transporter ATP-binding protein EcfA2 [Halosaccharopolyspora lacisalsi]